jgi:pantetheine-phosphate adenylyltransferase
MRKAIFPGSFDPITLGHVDIIKRALPIFDEIVIAIGVNSEKKYMFSWDEKMNFIEETFKGEPKISVVSYDCLTRDLAKKLGANFLLRGLRTTADFEFEKSVAQAIWDISKLETVFLVTSPNASFISSSMVRDVIRNRGEYKMLVPPAVRLKKNPSFLRDGF